MREAGEVELAVEGYRAAIAYAKAKRHVYPDALINLGDALRRLGRYPEASTALREAHRLQPDRVEPRIGLALVLEAAGRASAAIATYEHALALAPGNGGLARHLTSLLHRLGRFEAALEAYDRALEKEPDAADLHVGRARALLSLGRSAEGFTEIEWRRKLPNHANWPGPVARDWDGRSPLLGRTILAYGEQGVADTLQFARYLPLLAARGATVLASVDPALRPLFLALPGVTGTTSPGLPTPLHDVSVAMMSLPLLLDLTGSTESGSVPYLFAEPQTVARWGERVTAFAGLRVGFAWMEAPSPENALRLRPSEADLAALTGIEGISLISLQQMPGLPPLPGVDEPGLMPDWGEAAGLIANLDLVITVDTPFAHLAAAMGKPVWLLLPPVADWRWGNRGTGSAWYPTMRVFRQRRANGWAELTRRVGRALHAFADR